MLTTAGVLAGLSGAVSNHSQVVLAALASTVAGALSMGAGAYLGTHAETEVLRSELERTRIEILQQPYVTQEALLDELEKEGLGREAAYRVVRLLSSSPQTLMATAEQKVFGLGGALMGNAVVDGLVMGVIFAVGALIPPSSFHPIAASRQALAALGATAIALVQRRLFRRMARAARRAMAFRVRFLAIAMRPPSSATLSALQSHHWADRRMIETVHLAGCLPGSLASAAPRPRGIQKSAAVGNESRDHGDSRR